MAHRRKSSHPLCKQKRISTVVDLLTAKSQQESSREDSPDILELTNQKAAKNDQSSNESHGDSLEAVRQKIDLPDDLFKEFVKLKSVTNLDTADLMRKLLQDLDSRLHKGKQGEESDGSRDKSDAEKLSEYYREQEQRYLLKDENPREATRKTSGQPVDFRTLRAEYFQNGMENLRSGGYRQGQGYTYLFDGSEVKDGDEEETEKSNADDGEECSEYESYKSKRSKDDPKDQIEENEGDDRGPPPPYPFANIPGGIPYLPSALPGMVPIGTLPEGFPGIPGAMPIMQPNLSPESMQMMTSPRTNPMISGGISENESPTVNSKSKYGSPTQEDLEGRADNSDVSEESISQLWNPMQAKRTFYKTINPKKKNADKKKMILIAENTSNHGVYTSVLKLPWSRRTRTPKAEVGHPPTLATSETERSKKRMRSEPAVDPQPQMYSPPNSVGQQPPHPSYVFVPYPAVSLPNSQGVFIPSTSLPGMTSPVAMETPPANSQSMMMVYPNQNLNSAGKTVRKRGRPPKAPTVSKMLADSNKKVKYEASLPTFIQNFQACQPPAAIVLNVNNMLNTGNAVTATNSINASPATMSSASEINSQQTLSQTVVKEEPMPYAKDQESSTAVSVAGMSENSTTTGVSANINNMSTAIMKTEEDQPKKEETSVSSAVSTAKVIAQTSNNKESNDESELKMVTTTTMANAATGALYQEMILSSKSFVNARARGRRQSTNELLKSKSESQNFLCTSFRLRSLSGNKKEKKTTQYVPGMKRRGRPPKKRLENMFEGQLVEVSQEKLESMNEKVASMQKVACPSLQGANDGTPGMAGEVDGNSGQLLPPSAMMLNAGRVSSPTGSNSSDDRDMANEMFQQLFHCKLCNEIVPVDKKDSHWLKHSKKVSNRCNTCGGPYQKFLFREKEDADPVNMLKCENCEKVVASKHEVKSSNVDSLSVSCIECGEKFPSYTNLQQHISTSHPKLAAQYQSSQMLHVLSQKVIPEKSGSQPQGTEKIYECQEATCKKSYSTKMDLYAHVQRRHGGNQQVYCLYEGCEKKFQNDLRLQEHIQFKHLNTISIKSYKCSWSDCEEEFATERQLKIHLLVHQDEKPLKCAICDSRFRQKSALMWHLRKHHPDVNYESSQNAMDDVDEEESQ